MLDKVKNEPDRKLIQKIFAVDPVDWARYTDGTLSFISPTGQKFSYSRGFIQSRIETLNAKEKAAKTPPVKKPPAKAEEKTKTDPKAGAAA